MRRRTRTNYAGVRPRTRRQHRQVHQRASDQQPENVEDDIELEEGGSPQEPFLNPYPQDILDVEAQQLLRDQLRQFREEEQVRIFQNAYTAPQANLKQPLVNAGQENGVSRDGVNVSQGSNHQGNTTLQGPQKKPFGYSPYPHQPLEQIYPGQIHYAHPRLPPFLRQRALDLEAEHHID